MVQTEQRTCPACGATHVVQRHELSHHNGGTLKCPTCGRELIAWAGHFFYTLAIPHTTPPPRTKPGDDSGR
jgi:predicted Zn finger-like uncharacterized protein